MPYCLLSSSGNYGILKRMIASLRVEKKHILFYLQLTAIRMKQSNHNADILVQNYQKRNHFCNQNYSSYVGDKTN